MAGMNLNPYNNRNTEGLENKKMFSNHYGREIIKESDETSKVNNTLLNSYGNDVEQKPKDGENKHLKAYGYYTTRLEDVNLNKPVKKSEPKINFNLIIAGFLLLVGIITIILFILL